MKKCGSNKEALRKKKSGFTPPLLKMMLNKNFKCLLLERAGFTLLEMIIVLAVLALGFFPLIGLFSNGIVASEDVTKATIAIQLAEQKMEETRFLPFNSIANTSEAKGSIVTYPDFSRTVVIENTLTNLKKITVSADWGQGGSAGSFSLQTYIANF